MTYKESEFNHEKAQRLIMVAERSIKIIHALEGGASVNNVIMVTGAARQLVEYYKKILTTEE